MCFQLQHQGPWKNARVEAKEPKAVVSARSCLTSQSQCQQEMWSLDLGREYVWLSAVFSLLSQHMLRQLVVCEMLFNYACESVIKNVKQCCS